MDEVIANGGVELYGDVYDEILDAYVLRMYVGVGNVPGYDGDGSELEGVIEGLEYFLEPLWGVVTGDLDEDKRDDLRADRLMWLIQDNSWSPDKGPAFFEDTRVLPPMGSSDFAKGLRKLGEVLSS